MAGEDTWDLEDDSGRHFVIEETTNNPTMTDPASNGRKGQYQHPAMALTD
jgi:hypothetical protein